MYYIYITYIHITHIHYIHTYIIYIHITYILHAYNIYIMYYIYICIYIIFQLAYFENTWFPLLHNTLEKMLAGTSLVVDNISCCLPDSLPHSVNHRLLEL